jgi:hypothetical protein
MSEALTVEPSQARRIALNEDRFRELNERIVAQLESAGTDLERGHLTIVCECADPACHDTIAVTIDDYRRARDDGRHFIVVPYHVVAGTDRPLEQHREFWLVTKTGLSGEIAASLDA